MIHEAKMCSLAKGCSGVVTAIYNTGSMRRRLMDMGLIEGTNVVCMNTASGGDPSAFLIRGAVIALRREDSEKISILTADG